MHQPHVELSDEDVKQDVERLWGFESAKYRKANPRPGHWKSIQFGTRITKAISELNVGPGRCQLLQDPGNVNRLNGFDPEFTGFPPRSAVISSSQPEMAYGGSQSFQSGMTPPRWPAQLLAQPTLVWMPPISERFVTRPIKLSLL